MNTLPNDAREVLLSEKQIQERVLEIGREISRDYAGRDLALVGVLKGAVVFLADLARAISIPHTFDFIGASSYGDWTKSSGQVTITRDVTLDLKGRDILLIDDIYDSGRTIEVLKGLLELHHPASVHTCCFIFKETEANQGRAIPLRYYGFRIPDRFVVGYGLDFAERYRNLRCLAVLDPGAEDAANE